MSSGVGQGMTGTGDRSESVPPFVRLTEALQGWGVLFLQTARTKDVSAVEQILGGLVEWMGNDLLQGWLHLPIPLFEELSDLAEELFRACEAYLAWTRHTPSAALAEGRRPHEEAIRAVLARVRALAEARAANRLRDGTGGGA